MTMTWNIEPGGSVASAGVAGSTIGNDLVFRLRAASGQVLALPGERITHERGGVSVQVRHRRQLVLM